MKKVLLVVWLMLFSAGLAGCYQDSNGGWRLGMNEADRIEKGLDTAAEGLGLLSLFVPGAAGLAGIGAGIAGAFKKLKPELTKSKQTNEHIVSTIETIKGEHPDIWEDIKYEFKEGTNADIEEVIEKIVAMKRGIDDK